MSKTFVDCWDDLCRKCPSLVDPETKVEFKSKNLRDLLWKVYKAGANSGSAHNQQGDDFMDAFLRMFGTKQ